MTLSEQYAEALQNLLYVLKMIKISPDGVPFETLVNFARSEIFGLAQGFREKEECKGCADCCIKPMAIVPLQGIDGGVIRPLKYGIKYRRQPCWWLRQTKDGFRCAIHDSGEKPYTCYSYLCESRKKLEKIIAKAEKNV